MLGKRRKKLGQRGSAADQSGNKLPHSITLALSAVLLRFPNLFNDLI